MTRTVTFGDLRRMLLDCGFERVAEKGPYVVFEHEDTGVLQAFRPHRSSEREDPMTVASVKKTLVENGFVEPEEFEESLQEAARSHTGRSDRKAR
jgi:predicted RNA binding protein YcfA (HicA-like mRNA interferase family)